MGNTTRRTPISFNIPREPDYKFLNIAKFGGLYETDNPLTADYRTASDLLNVYVDEYDALTTRPRVAAVFDLYGAIDGEILFVRVLGNAIFIKVKLEDNNRLYYVKDLYDSEGRTPILLMPSYGVNLNDKDFDVLYYNDTYYILNDDSVLFIEEIIISGSTLYWLTNIKSSDKLPIPLVKERITPTTDGVVTGSKNILTNKYRQSFDLINWQTAFVADEIKEKGASIYKNDYFKKIRDNEHLYTLYDDGLFMFEKEHKLNYGYAYDVNNITTTNIDIPNTAGVGRYNISQAKRDGRFIFYEENDSDFIVYTNNSRQDYSVLDTTLTDFEITKAWMSPSGNIILLYYHNSSTDANVWLKYKINNDRTNYTKSSMITPMDSNTEHISNYDAEDFGVFIDYNDNIYFYYKNIHNVPSVSLYVDNSKFTNIYRGTNVRYVSNQFNLLGTDESEHLYISYVYYAGKPSIVRLDLNNSNTYDAVIYDAYGELVQVSSDGSKAISLVAGSQYDLYINGSYNTRPSDGFILYKGDTYSSRAVITSDFKYTLLTDSFYNPSGILQENVASPEPLLELLYTSDEELPELHLDKYIFFDNLFWFYSNDSNVVRWSTEDNPFDISVNNYDEVGDNTPIRDVELIGENALGLFKEKATYSVTGLTVGNIYTYSFTELVNDYGTVSETGVALTPISKLPIAVNLEEISGLYATKSIGTVNRYFTSITLGVDKKYKTFNSRKLRAETFKYWNLFIDSDSEHNESKILVRDDRTGDYFYWEVPISIDYCWSHDKQFYMLSIVDNKIYTFYTTDIRGANGNPNTYEYYDNDRQLIKWYYKSQILTLGTINYTKRLINTTFVMSDNDIDGDGYALNFSLTHYKQTPYTDTRPKNVSSDLLKLIQSTTKRTIIPKLKFLQFELTNTTSEYYDNELDNNKFRLVGLAFKYTLLEGLY